MTVSSDLRAAGAGPTGTWQAASSRTRLGVALVIGIAAAGAVGAAGVWVYAPLAGWDVAALSYTGWLWLSVIAVMTAAQTATHATCEDPSRATTGAVIVVAAVASLAAVGFILVQATSAKGSSQDLLASVGVLSVALSWFTVHTVFTLRYARLYYLGPDGGVNFNQDAPTPVPRLRLPRIHYRHDVSGLRYRPADRLDSGHRAPARLAVVSVRRGDPGHHH